MADVVKLSDEDAEWLYPGRQLEDTAVTSCDLAVSLDRRRTFREIRDVKGRLELKAASFMVRSKRPHR